MNRMHRDEAKQAFVCRSCGLETRRVNGEDMFDRTAPTPPTSGAYSERAIPWGEPGNDEATFARETPTSGVSDSAVEQMFWAWWKLRQSGEAEAAAFHAGYAAALAKPSADTGADDPMLEG